MRQPAARTSGLGTTVFAEMTALADATGSVNLGQGFPDADGPSTILDAAVAAIRAGDNQYPPGDGIVALREAIARHQLRHYGIQLDPRTEVLVTTGATEALTAALLAFVEPGDEVLALEPFYDSYRAAVQLAGGVTVPVPLAAPDFSLSSEALHAAVGPRTRVLLVNSPHNPTGAVLNRDELQVLAELAQRHDLLVISDEVYEHLTFDGTKHVPICTLDGMAARTLTVSSAGKMFSVTGWKVGWVSGPQALVSAVRSVKQFLSYASGRPFQPAVGVALDACDEWVAALSRDLEQRRDLLCEGLVELGLTVYRPRGTYFVITDTQPLGWTDAMAFTRELPERASVVAVPCPVFYADPDRGRTLVRWTFTKSRDTLGTALSRLASADLRPRT
jgi:N-succinyldiaminopimelate aminotransferase